MQFSTVSLSALQPEEINDARPTQPLPTVAGTDLPLDESFFQVGTADAAANTTTTGDDRDDSGARPLSVGLITLSSLPKLRWQTLLNLETIRVRSRSRPGPDERTDEANSPLVCLPACLPACLALSVAACRPPTQLRNKPIEPPKAPEKGQPAGGASETAVCVRAPAC